MPPQKRWHVRTSSFLSSQVVSNQVLSTYECLTTVFGMGTGGSTQLSPLDFFLRSTRASVPSKLYRRQMEHFRVMAKLHMLSTFVCLAAACGGQRQPITCALRAWFLGRFRIRPVTQSAFASWTGQQRSTSANHLRASRLVLGTFSHAGRSRIRFANPTPLRVKPSAY